MLITVLLQSSSISFPFFFFVNIRFIFYLTLQNCVPQLTICEIAVFYFLKKIRTMGILQPLFKYQALVWLHCAFNCLTGCHEFWTAGLALFFFFFCPTILAHFVFERHAFHDHETPLTDDLLSNLLELSCSLVPQPLTPKRSGVEGTLSTVAGVRLADDVIEVVSVITFATAFTWRTVAGIVLTPLLLSTPSRRSWLLTGDHHAVSRSIVGPLLRQPSDDVILPYDCCAVHRCSHITRSKISLIQGWVYWRAMPGKSSTRGFASLYLRKSLQAR